MADVTDAQQKRAEARKRRRKQDEPERESEPESSPQAGADGHDAGQGARQAAKLAAAIGAAGAAAAVAKALTSHGDEQKDEQDVEAPAPDDEPVAEEAEEPQDAAQADEQDAAGPEPQEEPEPERDPVQGAGAGDARRAIDRGREQLEDLLGRPVEKVSSLERTHDGWVLALEVVELQRIPETTDVLATYEMELDGDLNLRRYEQARRYHRGHTDNGDER
ncbi:MAG TPA: gas vesicle protein [Gaiellaceae bacterium]|nr:gas vesicle protein [Gaiellaceae bacterium]